jgi:hypothetical protein
MFTPEAITPQQRLRAAHLQGVRQISRVQIPLYGLPPGWNGSRFTGNTSFETGVTRDADGVHGEMHETVELVHQRGASRLVVESTDHTRSVDGAELLKVAKGGVVGEPLTIRLDGRAIAFATAHTDEVAVARWVGYEATVTVIAERWPMAFGLKLVRIADLAPYHEGRLRLLEERSGFDLRG